MRYVVCKKAPCNPVPTDYSNACFACSESNVTEYHEGKCSEEDC